MKKKTSKITKKGDWTFTKVAALILILITLVVVILAIFPGLRDPLGSLGVLIKGYTDSFKDFRSKPDSVKAQEEATEFNNRITRILEGSGTCEGYKEVQIIYSKAKRIGKQEPPTWEVCVQNKQGNVLTTDTNKYCDKISDAPKQEVSYFLKYIECKLTANSRDGLSMDTCNEVQAYLASSGITTFIQEPENAPYAPHKAYYLLAQCYQKLPSTPETQQKAADAYNKFLEYESKLHSDPEDVARAKEQIEKTSTTSTKWQDIVKKDFNGKDPIVTFDDAYALYSNPNPASRNPDLQTAHSQFENLITQIDKTAGTYDANTNAILRNLLANSYYFKGKSAYELAQSEDKCSAFAQGVGLSVTEDEASYSLSNSLGLKDELFRQGEYEGTRIMPRTLYELGHCYHETITPLPLQYGQDAVYFRALFRDFDNDPAATDAITYLKPNCALIEDDVLTDHELLCKNANGYLRDVIPQSSSSRKQLLCYYDAQGYFESSVCKPCSNSQAPPDQC